jgi:hypothetical protein
VQGLGGRGPDSPPEGRKYAGEQHQGGDRYQNLGGCARDETGQKRGDQRSGPEAQNSAGRAEELHRDTRRPSPHGASKQPYENEGIEFVHRAGASEVFTKRMLGPVCPDRPSAKRAVGGVGALQLCHQFGCELCTDTIDEQGHLVADVAKIRAFVAHDAKGRAVTDGRYQ